MGFGFAFDEKRRKEEELQKNVEEKENTELLMKQYEFKNLRSHLKLELHDLENLVKNGVLDKKLFEKVVADKKISKEEIVEIIDNVEITQILDKISEIEETKGIDKILPKKYRISKEDYLKAKNDAKKKKSVLQKIDSGLNFLFHQSNQIDDNVAQLFTSFAFVADKKLVLVQENLIDIKEDLA